VLHDCVRAFASGPTVIAGRGGAVSIEAVHNWPLLTPASSLRLCSKPTPMDLSFPFSYQYAARNHGTLLPLLQAPHRYPSPRQHLLHRFPPCLRDGWRQQMFRTAELSTRKRPITGSTPVSAASQPAILVSRRRRAPFETDVYRLDGRRAIGVQKRRVEEECNCWQKRDGGTVDRSLDQRGRVLPAMCLVRWVGV
jgi:hypothetical protein